MRLEYYFGFLSDSLSKIAMVCDFSACEKNPQTYNAVYTMKQV